MHRPNLSVLHFANPVTGLGDFYIIYHGKERLDSFFAEICSVSTSSMRTGRIYQRSHRRFTFVQIEENMIALENPKFSQEQLAEIGKTCPAKWVGCDSLYCVEGRFSLHLGSVPPKLH